MAGDRRLFTRDVAALMTELDPLTDANHPGEEMPVRTVNWFYYTANRHRRAGKPRPTDMPPEDGRDWQDVPHPSGHSIRVRSPWWWESTIRPWLESRPEARREVWAASALKGSRAAAQRPPEARRAAAAKALATRRAREAAERAS